MEEATHIPELKTYIGVKMIEATPMTFVEFCERQGQAPYSQKAEVEQGYLVRYPDGYTSWSPKDAFEAAYLPLDDPTRISQADVDAFIGPNAFEARQEDEKTTLVKMTPRTGFVQYETSSCVAPNNFDMGIGTRIASERIKERMWIMLGFVLQWAKTGLK